MTFCTRSRAALIAFGVLALAACQTKQSECVDVGDAASDAQPALPENVEGIEATIVQAGRDQAIATGDLATMHYTGWLYDPEAEDGRGEKFDSSRDRNQTFEFPLGGGRVIRGWDVGVAGMQLGEVRELKIAPAMGYGSRGAGNVIPPDATLLFEVELVSFKRCKVFD